MYKIYIHEVVVNKHLMCFFNDSNIKFQERKGDKENK